MPLLSWSLALLLKMKFFYFFLILFILAGSLIFTIQTASAYTGADTKNFLNKTANQAGLEEDAQKPEVFVANLIQILLSIAGVVFLAYFIYGGFVWMTAGGEETKIKNARKILIYATIGIAIIAAAYSITYFIAQAIEGGTA